MGPGDDAAILDYGGAHIPEGDAIELGKKYGEHNGFEAFVVVSSWQKLFWKSGVKVKPMLLIPAPPYGSETWVLSGRHHASEEHVQKERHRPVLHFTPQERWMNDPNGMFYKNGVYHLYYQYHSNPSW